MKEKTTKKLQARIRRTLPPWQKLKKEHKGPYYLVSTVNGVETAKGIGNIEELAKKLGVLKAWEVVPDNKEMK